MTECYFCLVGEENWLTDLRVKVVALRNVYLADVIVGDANTLSQRSTADRSCLSVSAFRYWEWKRSIQAANDDLFTTVHPRQMRARWNRKWARAALRFIFLINSPLCLFRRIFFSHFSPWPPGMQRVHYTNKSARGGASLSDMRASEHTYNFLQRFYPFHRLIFPWPEPYGTHKRWPVIFRLFFLKTGKAGAKVAHNQRITDVSQNNNLENIFYQFIFHFLSGGPALDFSRR